MGADVWEWEEGRERREQIKFFLLRFQGEMNAPDVCVAKELCHLSLARLDRS